MKSSLGDFENSFFSNVLIASTTFVFDALQHDVNILLTDVENYDAYYKNNVQVLPLGLIFSSDVTPNSQYVRVITMVQQWHGRVSQKLFHVWVIMLDDVICSRTWIAYVTTDWLSS